MARKSSSLADAFNQFDKVEEKEDKQIIEKAGSKSNTITKDVIQNDKTTKQQEKEGVNMEEQAAAVLPSKSLKDVSANIMALYDEKTSRKTMEETHKRSTFLFRRDLQKRLDDLADGKERGFKTLFLNQAIEALLNEMEEFND